MGWKTKNALLKYFLLNYPLIKIKLKEIRYYNILNIDKYINSLFF
jgi:hypothetical protein